MAPPPTIIRPWLAAASLFAAASLAALPPEAVADSTTATADSSRWWGKNQSNNGNNTWRWSTPTGAESIGWSSGPSFLDNAALWAQKQYGPEFKFTSPPLGARVFTGFTNTDGPNAPGLSTATQTGSGSSTIKAGTVYGTVESASWTVTASGVLGAPKLTAPGYTTSASASDPWPITTAQLNAMGLTGSSYNLFFPVGLQSGHFSAQGDITLDASYETSSGILSLLGVDVNAQHSIVTGDSQAKYFLLSSIDQAPPDITSPAMTASQLQATLQGDVQNGSIISPLYVGVELDNISVPTTDLGDGSVARIHIDSGVSDAASGAVPEPSTLVLAGIAIAGLSAAGVLRQRARRGVPARSPTAGVAPGPGVGSDPAI